MNTKLKSAFGTMAALALSVAAASHASASDIPQPKLTDDYVLSTNYVYDGHLYTAKDGVRNYSGTVLLPRVGSKNDNGLVKPASSATYTYMPFGSSYASSTERLQWFYDGVAYASGKKDFSNGIGTVRVIQVCFKYTRGGVDVIGWQCSNAKPGPAFAPGPVVKKTATDTLNPVAPQTEFRYSYKTA